jgi:hypothetical protein
MTDADFIVFLKRSQAALRKGGAIVVKENVCKDGDGGVPGIHFGTDDSSVTRYLLSYYLHYSLGSKDVTLDLTCIGRRFSVMLRVV